MLGWIFWRIYVKMEGRVNVVGWYFGDWNRDWLIIFWCGIFWKKYFSFIENWLLYYLFVLGKVGLVFVCDGNIYFGSYLVSSGGIWFWILYKLDFCLDGLYDLLVFDNCVWFFW